MTLKQAAQSLGAPSARDRIRYSRRKTQCCADDQRPITCDRAVVAAGIRSKELAKAAGDRVSILKGTKPTDLPVPVENQIRTYWWCSPPRFGRQRICSARSTARETGKLDRARAYRASIIGGTLAGARLELAGTDLRYAVLSEVDLTGVGLAGADVTGTIVKPRSDRFAKFAARLRERGESRHDR
jgi:glycine/D-amino acid oxidase-like deaminating enzyme